MELYIALTNLVNLSFEKSLKWHQPLHKIEAKFAHIINLHFEQNKNGPGLVPTRAIINSIWRSITGQNNSQHEKTRCMHEDKNISVSTECWKMIGPCKAGGFCAKNCLIRKPRYIQGRYCTPLNFVYVRVRDCQKSKNLL